MAKKLFYSADQAVEALEGSISRALMYRLMREHTVPTVMIGPRTFVSGAWIEQKIQEASRTEVDKNA